MIVHLSKLPAGAGAPWTGAPCGDINQVEFARIVLEHGAAWAESYWRAEGTEVDSASAAAEDVPGPPEA